MKLGLSAITGFRYHKPALSSTALQGTVIMSLIGEILLFGLNVYFYIIIASVIISWLIVCSTVGYFLGYCGLPVHS